MSSEFAETAGSIDKVETAFQRLLGVGWDKVLQWTIAGFASAWFWLNLDQPAVGPVDWLVEISAHVGLGSPQWIGDLAAWLAAQAASLLWVLPLLIAVFATAYVRVRKGTGLLSLAMLSALLAVQVAGSVTPIGWAALIAAAPACVALGIAARQWRRGTQPTRTYDADTIVIDFVLGALAFVWLPFLLPVLLLGALIGAYGRDVTHDPCETIARDAASRLQRDRKSVSDASATDVVALLLSALLADSPEQRRRMAFWVEAELSGPRGALPIGRGSLAGPT